MISASALQFKGTGWYVTDYGKGGKPPSSGAPAESKSEAKGEGNTLVGFTAASLRGLGSQRTLVLLNGRRLAPYALSGGHNGLTGAGRVPAVEQLWMSAFRSAQYLWLTASSAPRIPWTPRLRAYFLANFVPITEGPDWLYARKLNPSP